MRWLRARAADCVQSGQCRVIRSHAHHCEYPSQCTHHTATTTLHTTARTTLHTPLCAHATQHSTYYSIALTNPCSEASEEPNGRSSVRAPLTADRAAQRYTANKTQTYPCLWARPQPAGWPQQQHCTARLLYPVSVRACRCAAHSHCPAT